MDKKIVLIRFSAGRFSGELAAGLEYQGHSESVEG